MDVDLCLCLLQMHENRRKNLHMKFKSNKDCILVGFSVLFGRDFNKFIVEEWKMVFSISYCMFCVAIVFRELLARRGNNRFS